MIADDLVIGLRLGAMFLFTWLAWRVVFESWTITAQPEPARRRAWRYFRAAVLVLCFVMIFLASPENILRANGIIGERVGFWMMAGVTIGAILYATLMHHAIDIANGRRRATAPACGIVTLISGAWGIGRIWL